MFGLYIHWPFCRSKCPYCDFNSHVRNSVDENLWEKALLADLESAGKRTSGRRLTSVFFGGGTPSLMPSKIVAALLDRLSVYWELDDNLEVTLEANPNSVEVQKFHDFRLAGVNRVSLGIQSLDTDSLKFLGRLHNRDEALSAIRLAREIFDRYSFDLIYTRPDQTLDSWKDELTTALKLAGDHISLYQLSIEPGTAFYTAHSRGDWRIPEDGQSATFYEMTQDILESHGMPAYEVSSHARPGAECRHNLLYWRYHDYVGIGPGAHGRMTQEGKKWAIKNHRVPETWLQAVQDRGNGEEERYPLSRQEEFQELLMMGLRLRQGIPLLRLEEVWGKPFPEIFSPQTFENLGEEGYVDSVDTHLRLTGQGLMRLNSILEYLFSRIVS